MVALSSIPISKREISLILFQIFQKESLSHQCQRNSRTTESTSKMLENIILMEIRWWWDSLLVQLTSAQCNLLQWFSSQVLQISLLLVVSTQTSTWVLLQCHSELLNLLQANSAINKALSLLTSYTNSKWTTCSMVRTNQLKIKDQFHSSQRTRTSTKTQRDMKRRRNLHLTRTERKRL